MKTINFCSTYPEKKKSFSAKHPLYYVIYKNILLEICANGYDPSKVNSPIYKEIDFLPNGFSTARTLKLNANLYLFVYSNY